MNFCSLKLLFQEHADLGFAKFHWAARTYSTAFRNVFMAGSVERRLWPLQKIVGCSSKRTTNSGCCQSFPKSSLNGGLFHVDCVIAVNLLRVISSLSGFMVWCGNSKGSPLYPSQVASLERMASDFGLGLEIQGSSFFCVVGARYLSADRT